MGLLCVDQAGLEVVGVFLPLLPRCWDCSLMSPNLVLHLFLFQFNPRATSLTLPPLRTMATAGAPSPLLPYPLNGFSCVSL